MDLQPLLASGFSFDILPQDVVGHIFGFLSHKSLRQAAQVCFSWSRLTALDQFWSSRCYVGGPHCGLSAPRVVTSELARHAGSLHSLCLSEMTGFDFRLLLPLLENSPVEFMFIHKASLYGGVPQQVYGFGHNPMHSGDLSPLKWPSRLKYLSLKACELPSNPFSNCRNLERLMIDGCSVRTFGSAIKYVFRFFTTGRSSDFLPIGITSTVSDFLPFFPPTRLPILASGLMMILANSLHLIFGISTNFVFFRMNCPKLEYLCIRDCHISVNSTDAIQLKKLHFYLHELNRAHAAFGGFGGGGVSLSQEQPNPDALPVVILRPLDEFFHSIHADDIPKYQHYLKIHAEMFPGFLSQIITTMNLDEEKKCVLAKMIPLPSPHRHLGYPRDDDEDPKDDVSPILQALMANVPNMAKILIDRGILLLTPIPCCPVFQILTFSEVPDFALPPCFGNCFRESPFFSTCLSVVFCCFRDQIGSGSPWPELDPPCFVFFWW